ncbi:MAG: hypothetical protein ONB44_23090 [candidate division KSB1 bacterium]|nr:hypothetical protein [candidate division KSB1 bacterium]MDZ7305026.1 hypothetical protein [candidate division KSB1 bacterium]MDZ7314130.1 hypothetical protein [candidate division KSB1 bacterium]
MLQNASEFLKITNLIVTGCIVIGGLSLFYFWLKVSEKLKTSLLLHLRIQRIIDVQLQSTPKHITKNLIKEAKKREGELLYEIKKRDDEIARLRNALKLLKPINTNKRETMRDFFSRQMAEMELKTFRKEFAFFFLGLIGPSTLTLLGKGIALSYKLLAGIL